MVHLEFIDYVIIVSFFTLTLFIGLYVSKSIKPQTRAQADAVSVEDEALDREMEAGIAEFDRLDDDDPSSRS